MLKKKKLVSQATSEDVGAAHPAKAVAPAPEKPQVVEAPPAPKIEEPKPVAETVKPVIKAEPNVQRTQEAPVKKKISNIPLFGGDVPKVEDVLNGSLNVKEEPEHEVEELVVREEIEGAEDGKELKQEELVEYWNSYGVKMQDKEPRLASTIHIFKPTIESNTVLKLVVANESQQKAVFKAKPSILSHLRRCLKVNELDLLLDVREDVEVEQRYYTQADKFKFLNEKNPDLMKLKKQFNLDFN